MTPVIEVEQLSKYYGTTIGIQDVSFTVEEGEIFGFLGPNGSGKTTTIRLLLDLIRPGTGTVRLFGRDISGGSQQIRRRCGYLPGNFSAYDSMTADDFLKFIARIRRAENLITSQLAERFRLNRKDLSRKIKQLSLGTRQKLGILQAFAHQPDLLILDEPTTGLDPLMQEELYELIRENRQAGRTIFISSHNLPEVEKICQRVAIVREGELVALETLQQLKKKRFRRLKIVLNQAVENLQLPSSKLLSHRENEYEFMVKGDLTDLLKRLAELPLTNLVFPEPDLEEVFMAYYRSEG